MSYIITIGRQYGSGGRFIAQELAKKLNIPFYDNALLAKAAQDSGLSENVLQNYDEKRDGLFSGIMPSVYGVDMSMGQKVFLAQFEAIKRIADAGSCIIVGRCADYVLRERTNVVNVFITAPLEQRIENGIKYFGLEPKKAKDIIIKTDKKRASYYNFYSDKKWGRAESYNLIIDSTAGIDACCEVIKVYTEAKLGIKID